MKAKTFIQNLSKCIFEEYKEEIPKEELRSSFVQAIKNISAGKLQDDLNENFDKNLKRLEKSLKNLCTRELPSISSHVDDSLEELTKSELGSRTEVTEDEGTKHLHKVIFNLLGDELKKPKPSDVNKLNKTHRCLLYRSYLQKILSRKDASDEFIQTVIQDFDDTCEISKQDEDGKSKFDWLPICSLLLELVTGCEPLAYIRVLKILYDSVTNDVNKCLAKSKHVRSGKLAAILKKFTTCCHLHENKHILQETERKMYCRYMSALLSLYIDLCCIYSSKVEQKKMYGREIAGYVCYILQPWPECLLEVALQLQGLEEDDHVSVLLPLIRKCLEVKPSGTDHVYYLKYILLVRQVKDAYGEYEQIQEWNYATKNIPASSGFFDWLQSECPEASEHVPVEDKKFKKTQITRFFLEEAEDDLITILLNSLCKEDEDKKIDVEETKEDEETIVTMETGPLFYLDKTRGSSTVELADDKMTKEINSNASSKETLKKGSKKGRKNTPIVLKTIADVEKIVDSKVKEDEAHKQQTYTLDPKLVMEKVVDPEDQRFLQSEIISITSLNAENDLGFEGDKMAVKGNESQLSNSSDKSGKWGESSSSTPSKKRKRNKKKSTTQESDFSDISAIERSQDFCDSISSMSEDNYKVKSVVRKVTPEKMKPVLKSQGKDLDSGAKSKGSISVSADESDVIEIESDVIKENSEVGGDDTYTENNDENVDDAPLSSIHESSAEIVDLVLEPEDKPDDETISNTASNDGSPKKQVSNISGKKEESGLTESSLSCLSGLSTVTNYSETIEITTTDVSGLDQNSTLEASQLDNTAKFIGGKSQSPVKSTSGSESDSVRGKSRKRSAKDKKDVKSPRNNTSEIYQESESDGDVFRKTPDTKKEAKAAKSIEEKFIVKATKGKKTPKKSGGQCGMNQIQQVSGSVSLFAEESVTESENEHNDNEDIGKRTKSTEEIIQIVEEIKDKINTPRTRKSKSKSQNPNESMFTDDSVESLEKESNISTEEQKSAKKKQKLRSDSSSKISPRKTESNKVSDIDMKNLSNEQCEVNKSVEKCNSKGIKTPSKVKLSIKAIDDTVLIESSDVSDIEQPVCEEKLEKSVDSPHKNKNIPKSPGKHVSSTPPSTEKSPSKGKNKRTPRKSDASNVKDGDESDKVNLDMSVKSSPKVSEDVTSEISVNDTPNKQSASPNKSLNRSVGKRQNSYDNKTILIGTDSKSIVSDSEDETEKIVLSPAGKSNQDKSPETIDFDKTPSSVKKNIKTPQSDKKSVKTPQSNKKVKTPQSSGKKDAKSPQSDQSIKTPRSDRKIQKTPQSGQKDLKSTQANEDSIKTPQSSMKINKTPQSGKKDSKSQQSDEEKIKTPQSGKKVKKTPQSDKKFQKTPQSDKKIVKTPRSEKENCTDEIKYNKSPADGKKKTTPQKVDSTSRLQLSALGQISEEQSVDSADDFVPSSQKKENRKSEMNETDKKKLTVLSTSVESDEDIDFLPNIGSHLKVPSPSTKALDSKSPNIPTDIGANASRKKKINETTPLKGSRLSLGVKGSANKNAEAGTDNSTKKRVTRARRISEPVLGSEKESDTDGPTRPKRLRSATKADSEPADSSATKVRPTRSKADLKKNYDYHSGTDGATDQSDNEARSTRRLRGGARLSAIKDKIPEAVDEEQVPELSTPRGKSQRQRTGSASTTKKAVMKHAEVRGTRKRRLSGELAAQDKGGNSTDSEVSFPKTKQVSAVEKKSKRLSAPVLPASAEAKTDASGKRYTLRKK